MPTIRLHEFIQARSIQKETIPYIGKCRTAENQERWVAGRLFLNIPPQALPHKEIFCFTGHVTMLKTVPPLKHGGKYSAVLLAHLLQVQFVGGRNWASVSFHNHLFQCLNIFFRRRLEVLKPLRFKNRNTLLDLAEQLCFGTWRAGEQCA